MIEIMFRGKRVDNGEWVFGYLREIWGKDERTFLICPALEFDETGVYDMGECLIIPETIGQYTGLDDKDGNKIFEGDIDDEGRVVIFSSEYLGFFIYDKKECVDNQYKPLYDDPLFKISGNIHDNKELL